MNWCNNMKVVRWLAAVALAMSVGTAGAHNDDNDADELLRHAKRSGISKPIVETHIHFYQPSRPGGVPWPNPTDPTVIYRDVLPAEYTPLAKAHGVVLSGIVEASPLVEDNQWVLDLVKRDRFYPFFVGQLEIGSPTFAADLARFSNDKRFVGIRGYLWSPAEGITLSAAQLANLRDLARRGMSLDIISRGTTNPKPQVEALCAAVPNLRIIINHLAGAQGAVPSAEWELSIRRLADLCPNLYIKFSSFFDMFATGAPTWTAPTDLASYKPTFDVFMTAFGPDRMIWGSNWPVSDLGGSYTDQIRIAEEYLASFGTKVRDKVMFKNALNFYSRHVVR
jgi:predicted TIM-barrel fold metal-dependent hydrolase